MTHRRRRALLLGTVATALTCSGLLAPALAEPEVTAVADDPGVQLEGLDRGLVAVPTDDGVMLSWRLRAGEVTGATAAGLTGPTFVLTRDGEPLAEVDGTSYLDVSGDAGSMYTLQAVLDGVVLDAAEAAPWEESYLDVALNKPADGVTPVGEEYTYAANDVSVGDLDGDGRYEVIVKWEPSNAKDVSQVGYTGATYLDAYTLDGEQLWRVDLGVNIRSGAHYTQFPVMDFDGDGRAELMVKTAPGTAITRYTDGVAGEPEHITMPAADLSVGYSHSDDYRLSAQGYYEHLVEMFRGWTDNAEVADGLWPATLEEAFGIEPRHDYPLSDADARDLVDYFVDEWAPARSERNQLRDFEGFILSGPEYLTVIGGDGAELQTIRYNPSRDDDGLRWHDYATPRIEPGNRVDRFLAGAAYLDGRTPSAVFARGYYTRSTLVAYDWDGERLSERWYVDSGHIPVDNPFNPTSPPADATNPEYAALAGQGFHSLGFADVDGDGRHDVVYGAATIGSDGSLLYASTGVMPEGGVDPGEVRPLGHGDAMHVADILPDRPGLEIFTVHEGGRWAPYSYALRDAATGEVIHGEFSGRDTGRGTIGDVRPDVPGMELWASMPAGAPGSGLLAADGTQLEESTPGTNMSVRWAADGTTQLINGSVDPADGSPQPVTIDTWATQESLQLEGVATNNWTKGNPGLVADILGDAREEVLTRTVDSDALRIFTPTDVSERTMYTLMHDPQYRVETARQQTTYNQPAYPGFFYASDTDFTEVPVPVAADRGALELDVAVSVVSGTSAQEGAAAGDVLAAAVGPDARVGDVLELTVTTSNAGTVPLAAPRVTTSLGQVLACEEETIEAGGSTTCAVDEGYVVTAADLESGQVETTVTAWAATPANIAGIAPVREVVTTGVVAAQEPTPAPTAPGTEDPTGEPTSPASPGAGGDDGAFGGADGTAGGGGTDGAEGAPDGVGGAADGGGTLPTTGVTIGAAVLAALALLTAGTLLLLRRHRTARS